MGEKELNRKQIHSQSHSRSIFALPYHFDPAQRPCALIGIRELEPAAVCFAAISFAVREPIASAPYSVCFAARAPSQINTQHGGRVHIKTS
jgi:hypothetical protein